MYARVVLVSCLTLALHSAPVGAAAGSEQVSGWCTFTGTMTPDGRLEIAYGGYALAASTSGLPPAETVLSCTVESPAQGLAGEAPTLRETVSATAPGAVAVVADTTPPWPVRPVRVCVSGWALFDPVTPRVVDITRDCRWEPFE